MKYEGDDAAVTTLLQRNRAWAERKTETDPNFFARLTGQQRPRYFWIGCADSRVPATEIVDLDPGEMFVHRNVANVVHVGDPNFEAALGYAVETLEIRHILLVGHYGCGGIDASLAELPGFASQWLRPLKAMAVRHESELADLDKEALCHRLCELNVIEQVAALAAHPIIGAAWNSRRDMRIDGLIYAVGDGLLGHVCSVTGGDRRVAVKAGYGSAI